MDMSHREIKNSKFCSLQQKTGLLTTKDNQQKSFPHKCSTHGISSCHSPICQSINFEG